MFNDLERNKQKVINPNDNQEQYVLQALFRTFESKAVQTDRLIEEGEIERLVSWIETAKNNTKKELNMNSSEKGKITPFVQNTTWTDLFQGIFKNDPPEARIASLTDINRILMNACLRDNTPTNVDLVDHLSIAVYSSYCHVQSYNFPQRTITTTLLHQPKR